MSACLQKNEALANVLFLNVLQTSVTSVTSHAFKTALKTHLCKQYYRRGCGCECEKDCITFIYCFGGIYVFHMIW